MKALALIVLFGIACYLVAGMATIERVERLTVQRQAAIEMACR
jgi:hypothetical protein